MKTAQPLEGLFDCRDLGDRLVFSCKRCTAGAAIKKPIAEPMRPAGNFRPKDVGARGLPEEVELGPWSQLLAHARKHEQANG
jgi:hypothetical protein